MVGPGVLPRYNKFNSLDRQTALSLTKGAKGILLRCKTRDAALHLLPRVLVSGDGQAFPRSLLQPEQIPHGEQKEKDENCASQIFDHQKIETLRGTIGGWPSMSVMP